MSLRMLITDDDPNLLQMYQTLFGKQPGLSIDYAASPAACRAYLASGRYDLALLDVCLGDPEEDGVALLSWVRRTRPETGVMMMSSLDSPELVERCLALGAAAFTSKNHDFVQSLRERVERFADARFGARPKPAKAC